VLLTTSGSSNQHELLVLLVQLLYRLRRFAQLSVWHRMPLLTSASCLCRLLLLLSRGANAGSQHAAMNGDAFMLLRLLGVHVLGCLTAVAAGVCT
jgi:hypothetical protein